MDKSCIHLYPLVSGYKLLVRDTCIRLLVGLSDVNAALRFKYRPELSHEQTRLFAWIAYSLFLHLINRIALQFICMVCRTISK